LRITCLGGAYNPLSLPATRSGLRPATSKLANVLNGVEVDSGVKVKRGRMFPYTLRLDFVGGRLRFSGERSWPLGNLAKLSAEVAGFASEVQTAICAGRAGELRLMPAVFRPRPNMKLIEGRRYEFGMTLTDALHWRAAPVQFKDSPEGTALAQAQSFALQRRQALWSQLAYVGPLFLILLMAASWAIPLNWWSVSLAGFLLALCAFVYAFAYRTHRLGKGGAVAMAATVVIATFGLVYATLLAVHPQAPESVWGARLGRAFLMSVGVTTAGTLDQPLREAVRVAINIQLLLLVGGAAGTAGWAALRAIRGISEVDQRVALARNELGVISDDITRVTREVRVVQGRVDEAVAQAQQTVSGSAADLLGSLGGLDERLLAIERLLREIAGRIGYQEPPPPASE
jgi:hypothetical protein